MAKILDRDDKAVLIKFTVSEYERLTTSWLLDSYIEDFSDYEFVFDKPVKASDLLKAF
jgi:hypothetical protein